MLGLAAPAGAAAPAPAPAKTDAQVSPEALALALARLMAPSELRVSAELREFDLHFKETLLQQREVKELDEKYPGLVDAMARSVRPLVAEQTIKVSDGVHPAIAKILVTELNPREIAELSAYYGSPAGRNWMRAMANSIDASDIYKSAITGKEPTQGDADGQLFIASMKAMGNVSDADRQALKTLMASPVYSKLRVVQAQLKKIIMEASLATDPEYEKRVEEVMTAAVADHITALEASSSKPSK